MSSRDPESTAPSAEVFDLALRHVSDGVVVIGRDWRYLYLNPRAEQMLGHPTGALVGRDYRELFPEALESPFFAAYRRAMDEGESTVFEDHYEPWDRWFENRVHPAPHDITILFSDITGRKRAEAALQEREQRLGRILRTVAVGVWSWNFERGTITAQQSLAPLVGIESDGPVVMTAADWFAHVHEDDRADVRARLDALRDRGVAYDAVFRFRHARGHDVLVHATGQPVCDKEGRVVERRGTGRTA